MPDRRTQVRVVVVAAVLALGVAALVLATADHRDRGTAGTRKNPVVLVLSQPYGDAAVAAALGEELSRGSGLIVKVRWMPSRPEASCPRAGAWSSGDAPRRRHPWVTDQRRGSEDGETWAPMHSGRYRRT